MFYLDNPVPYHIFYSVDCFSMLYVSPSVTCALHIVFIEKCKFVHLENIKLANVKAPFQHHVILFLLSLSMQEVLALQPNNRSPRKVSNTKSLESAASFMVQCKNESILYWVDTTSSSSHTRTRTHTRAHTRAHTHIHIKQSLWQLLHSQ